jgi:hypothetical protein
MEVIMKLILDVADSKAAAFMEMIKEYSYIKAKALSEPDAEILNEIKEIKKAFGSVDKIKSGKLKGRPVEELLNEL